MGLGWSHIEPFLEFCLSASISVPKQILRGSWAAACIYAVVQVCFSGSLSLLLSRRSICLQFWLFYPHSPNMFHLFPSVFSRVPESLRVVGQFVLPHPHKLDGGGWEVETNRGGPGWFLLNCCWFIFPVFPRPIKGSCGSLPLPFTMLFTFEKREMELLSVRWSVS